MQVFTARSSEAVDIDYLCDDLARQIAGNVTFGQRTLGIAICDSTIDYRAVMKRLSEIYSFDIYGCTCLAFIRIHAEEDISVSFMVITGNEELVGSMALSEPLTGDDREQLLRETYALARRRLGEDPKMILSLQPFSASLTAEYLTSVISDASGHCPIYGAVSSADLATDVSGVFVNGEFYEDRLLLNLLGGGIRPLFAVANAEIPLPQRATFIKEAEGNVVRRVGDMTFLEFMEKNGLVASPSYVLDSFIATYASSPVFVYEQGNFEGTKKVRNIIDINYESGAVTFTGDMPEGSGLAIGLLTRDEIMRSSVACFEEMIGKIEAGTSEQYRYSTLFSTSFGGRYLVMSGDTSVEGDFITHNPALKDLASCGFYAMGEICPVSVDENGRAENRAHHSSITLMAL